MQREQGDNNCHRNSKKQMKKKTLPFAVESTSINNPGAINAERVERINNNKEALLFPSPSTRPTARYS